MDFSDRIRAYQAKAIYSDLVNRSTQLGSNCGLFVSCSSTGCKINFQTFELREQIRQGRAECTGSNTYLAAYVGPKLSIPTPEPEPEPEPEPGPFIFTVTTLAGDGSQGFNDAIGTSAQFNNPRGIDILPNGNVVIADSLNNRIRLLRLNDNNVTTIAGNGNQGSDNGIGTNASFNFPSDVAVLSNGNVVISDGDNSTIRLLTFNDSNVTTIAGSPGDTVFADGIGTNARFNILEGLAVLSNGNIVIVDSFNCRIRLLTLNNSNVTTIAGNGIPDFVDGIGTTARFHLPIGIAVLSNGNIVVADTFNNRIRLITPNSNVTTLAGSNQGFADGIGTNASFDEPSGIAVLPNGNIVVADTNNNRIRLVTPQGEVTTIAGSNSGFANGIGIAASFRNPRGLAVLPNGNIVVADTNNQRIRLITISV